MQQDRTGAAHAHEEATSRPSETGRARLLYFCCALLSLMTACAHGQAASVVELPPLDRPGGPGQAHDRLRQAARGDRGRGQP